MCCDNGIKSRVFTAGGSITCCYGQYLAVMVGLSAVIAINASDRHWVRKALRRVDGRLDEK
jgi:hypothetical protein